MAVWMRPSGKTIETAGGKNITEYAAEHGWELIPELKKKKKPKKTKVKADKA